MRTSISTGLSLLLCICLMEAGCSSSPPAKPSSGSGSGGGGSTEAPAAPAVPDDHYGTAVIQGRVSFEGKRPSLRPIPMTGDNHCASVKTPAFEEGKMISEDGGVPHVFVYVKSGINGKYTVPEEPVVLTQKDCRYDPHIFGVRVGQTLKIVNGDPTAHNVHSMAKKNERFNFAQTAQHQVNEKVYKRAEIGAKIKCDVHGWMLAFCNALPHPFFAVSDADGKFKIERLPPGEYEIEIWHELYGTRTKTVTIKEGETLDLDFLYAQESKP